MKVVFKKTYKQWYSIDHFNFLIGIRTNSEILAADREWKEEKERIEQCSNERLLTENNS